MTKILASSRFWLHVVFPGIPNALLCKEIPSLGIVVGLGFIAYELWQGFRIRDSAWLDIQGWLAGAIGMGILILLI